MLIMFVTAGVESANATASLSALMELPPFERAVLIIRYYETLHGKEKWPTIGFGHVVQPGQPYKEFVSLTEREADALLRKDLKKFCAMFRSFSKDSLLLACVSYNCGPAKILGSNGYKKSWLIRKLESGNRDILHEYLSFCHYNGKVHLGIRRRRWVEYRLLWTR